MAEPETKQYGGTGPFGQEYKGEAEPIWSFFDPGGLLFEKPATYTRFRGTSKYQPSQQALLDQMVTYYGSTIGKALPSYEGTQVANLSEGEQKAGNIYGNLTPNDYSSLIQSLSGLAMGTPQYYEEAYRTNVEEPTIENWLTKLMPELKAQYSKKGLLYGSGREVAERESLSDLTSNLVKGRTQLASDLEQMKTTAVPLLASILGLSNTEAMKIAEGLATTGATERGVEQNKLDKEYQAWLRNQPGTRPVDTLLVQLLGLEPINEDQIIASPPGKSGLCIIITTCTSRDSEEVQIAREYRDKYLDTQTLRGYYVIAEVVVPLLRFNILKKLTKRFLVDKLIRHAKGKHNLTTKIFLKLCNFFGARPVFVRANGEVV
jgi:hypothetical protein